MDVQFLLAESSSAERFVFVLLISTATAIATGLGVLPFLFLPNIGKQQLGIGNAIASGLIAGASIGLVWEGVAISPVKLVSGLAIGAVLIWSVQNFFSRGHDSEKLLVDPENKNWNKILLIMVVMTMHSFAEGVGIGVSFGGRDGFGEVISAAIAIHNIPEGLSIGLVMIPRGYSVRSAGLWSIFSSLPQPLMAIPAYWFVLQFAAFLPIGLGIAAGAMVYILAVELIPEAIANLNASSAWSIFAVSLVLMLVFQFALV